MLTIRHSKLFISLLLSALPCLSSAEIILDFSGLNKNKHVVNATLALKDSYQFGKSVTPNDVINYRLYDIKGEKDSSNNWQLKAIDAVIDPKGKVIPFSNGTALTLYDQFDGTIFWMGANGKWEAHGGGNELSGTAGQWTMQKTASKAEHKQTAVTQQHCINGDHFHKAAAKGDLKYLQACLQAGMAVNAQEGNGWTALHAAARQGKTQVVQTLLRHGANAQIRDTSGRTALDQATLAKQYNVINILKGHTPSPVRPGKNALPPSHASAPPNGRSEASTPMGAYGAYHTTNMNDQALFNATKFLEAELHARDGKDIWVKKVLSASTQVVAGTNYRLNVLMSDGHTYEAVIYRDLKSAFELTSYRRIK